MVNILEVDVTDLIEKFKGKDRFRALFELVKQQNNVVKPLDLNTKEGQQQWKNLVYCLSEELCEAIGAMRETGLPEEEQLKWIDTAHGLIEKLHSAANQLKNRPWVKTEYTVDYNHLYDEVGDCVWFFIALLEASGLDSEAAFEVFLKKFRVNEFRQKSNY